VTRTIEMPQNLAADPAVLKETEYA